MRYCPLMSYGKQYCTEVSCFEEECALAADEAGNCLIQQALQLYVSQERTKIAEQTAMMQHFNNLAAGGYRYISDENISPLNNVKTSEVKIGERW